MSAKVFPLKDSQLAAVQPNENVWLSASAGTGKTQVLSARVLRLLLRPDVEPGQILCLTFTKAGAAEMANRINAVLARWVRLEDTKLFTELKALGADLSPQTRERARTLFASVLDCPGGGLRIDTIHAFSQWLLGNFPEEADLAPGSRPMDDRQRELLARDTLADLLIEAEAANDTHILEAVDLFVTTKDPGALRAWLMRCAEREELWQGPDGWQSPVITRVQQLLGMPANAQTSWAEEILHPDLFPDAQLRQILPCMEGWNTKSGSKITAFVQEWLSRGGEDRAEVVEGFYSTLLKQDGTPRQLKKPTSQEPRLEEWQSTVAESLMLYQDRLALLDLARFLAAALDVGRAFSIRWVEAKRREGLLDFNDLIRRAAELLKRAETAEWIRFKLDRQFDHILIDEAQDTNQSQWDIVDALIDDFFSGEGASGDKLRTVFTVGDYKQAIFGFQGTSPENYERAKAKIQKRIEDARKGALAMRDRRAAPNWLPLDLERSFRTAQPVLDFVNTAIGALGHESFGLPVAPPDHVGSDRAGLITLCEPVLGDEAEDPDRNDSQDSADEDKRDWLSSHHVRLAEKIAAQIDQWVNGPDRFVLEKDEHRFAEPGDVMVLVQKRGELAAQIVAELHKRRVAVAGVDRLRLGAPLAVRDVLSALRFAVQPLDDLNCANTLVSPLIGWTQDDLLEHAPRPKDRSLWDHLRRSDAPDFVMRTADQLRQALRLADFETPQAMIAWLLTGPWRGRERLVARLGQEANDPLDELLNVAFAYESANTPSLAGFLAWFDAGTTELKRDPDGASGQVRVMTVHGSKGLQAPIVVLADATNKPGKVDGLDLEETPLGHGVSPIDGAAAVPLPSLSAAQKVGPVKEAETEAVVQNMAEHWRLLYVAMTRAEEALWITGSLSKKDAGKGPHEDSWYARLAPLFADDPMEDFIWDERREYGYRAQPPSASVLATSASQAADPTLMPGMLPDWAKRPIGAEPKPPRPLSPSGAGEDQGADPPILIPGDPAGQRTALRRGTLIHRLLERLPDIEPELRQAAAFNWLERQASELAPQMRMEIVDQAMSVLNSGAFAELFSPEALAEVPISATVNASVITGVVDRLLVGDRDVLVVDFKTDRRPPRDHESMPLATKRQMAAYAAALEAIYPGKNIRVGVLYTQTPQLIELPSGVLNAHKDRFGPEQESYGDLSRPTY